MTLEIIFDLIEFILNWYKKFNDPILLQHYPRKQISIMSIKRSFRFKENIFVNVKKLRVKAYTLRKTVKHKFNFRRDLCKIKCFPFSSFFIIFLLNNYVNLVLYITLKI